MKDDKAFNEDVSAWLRCGGVTVLVFVSFTLSTSIAQRFVPAAASLLSIGIGQISTAVAQMDEVTQQNASLVEEAAAAARSLEEQANHLTDAAAVFVLNS
jgi:methyl-accepting chemotaxis protein